MATKRMKSDVRGSHPFQWEPGSSLFEDNILKSNCGEKEQVAEPGTLNLCLLHKLLFQEWLQEEKISEGS